MANPISLLGKRKVRGDLFKDMREYLDERETDPLP
jgi:hypothetical protein